MAGTQTPRPAGRFLSWSFPALHTALPKHLGCAAEVPLLNPSQNHCKLLQTTAFQHPGPKSPLISQTDFASPVQQQQVSSRFGMV